ncbi:MAG: DUF3943 domain-containing protein [Candidatus Aminicenantes bacterium]|nr:DUF3943 domain-containing protein [Candidatus Aminicenantes bacterium]
MSKTLIGVMAAALLWVGNPVPCRGEVLAPERFELDLCARLDVAGALAAEGSATSPTEASTPNRWWGVRVNLARSPWSPASEVVSLNLGVWSISHYLLHDPWSDISPETIQRNFKTGLVWDKDGLLMNCLAHPFHGSTYFNIARASGLSFWESVPLALGGSAMWEACMENEPASRSDLIFTTCGGVYLGELFYRLSSRILDGRAGGLERAGREFVAFILNPAGGLHRLFRGDMFRHEPAGNDVRSPFETRYVVGRTRLGNDPFVAVTFRSGDPFAGAASPKAFDFFVHRSRFRFGNNLLFTQSGYGYLGGTRFGRAGAPNHVLGLFLHFDLRKAEAVRLGASSLTGGLVSRFQLGNGARLETALQFGATLLGGFDNPQVRKGPRMDRDYNFGSGAVAKVEAALDLGKWGTLRTNFAQHYLVVLEGTPGVDRAAFLEASYEIPVYKSWTVGVEVVDVRRHSDYRDVSDIQARYADYQLIAGVRF